MNNELIDALEALLEAAPDADSLRVLVGQATANKGPMSAEEFIAFARELLDAARKADQTGVMWPLAQAPGASPHEGHRRHFVRI